MNSYLKGIVLFSDKGEKRLVPLKRGVNIIEGDSKTGKSALVEIIDYCLCSSRCTIPKGKITNFTSIYCIVMVIDKACYIIARHRWEDSGKMYFEKEMLDYDIDNLQYDYFKDKSMYAYKMVQKKIELALGLVVSNLQIDEGEDKSKKASLRNMVSYLFQHQNLIASKFALFYRFSDYYKRKDVIEQFPVFAGFIGQEYYSDMLRLNKLKADFKRIKKTEESNGKVKERMKRNFLPIMKNYYALLDLELDGQISLSQLMKMANDLPEFDDNKLFQDNAIVERHDELDKVLEQLRDLKRDKLIAVKHLSNVNSNGNEFNNILEELRDKTAISNAEIDQYICPICGNNCTDINEQDKKIDEASKWLDSEIKITSNYAESFSEDIRKLESEKDNIDSEINFVFNQIKDIEKKFMQSKELVSKREKVNYAKVKIQLYLDMLGEDVFQIVDKDIVEIEDEIERLKKKIDGFDVETKIMKTQNYLSINMNRLALGLDFEDEYKPINLNFGLQETFDIYQYQDKHQKIFLDEMGSGANWVSCHIALFLSFLRFFAKEDKSPMPLIMFFDQPSQVYFPHEIKKGVKSEENASDMKAVNNMYRTIFDEINSIGEDTGILPQIIIVDHVNGDMLDVKDRFKEYRRCNWRNKEGLI